jgi:hypothetical protein
VVVFIWLPVILHGFAMVFRTELIMKLLFWILKSVISYEGELELPCCHMRREDGHNTGNHSFGDG